LDVTQFAYRSSMLVDMNHWDSSARALFSSINSHTALGAHPLYDVNFQGQGDTLSNRSNLA